MKKTIIITLALVFALSLIFAGCGKVEEIANTPIVDSVFTVSQIYDKVKEVAGFGGMTAVPQRDYSDIYGIDASKISESVWYMSENPSLNADEVAIFKLSDSSYADTLAGIFRDRISRQLEVAKTYSPDEAGKLEKAEVVVAGSYVYYCVGKASDAMMAVFKTLIK